MEIKTGKILERLLNPFKTIINHYILITHFYKNSIFLCPEYTHICFHMKIRFYITSIKAKYCLLLQEEVPCLFPARGSEVW